MGKSIDLTGQKFGRLTVIGRATTRRSPSGATVRYWLCACSCAAARTTEVSSGNLRRGQVKSCGCIVVDVLRKRNTRHGCGARGKETREHKSWRRAKDRCCNPRNNRFRYYGGRGIKMCIEWRENFAAFFAYLGKCPPGMSLDRIDFDGDYEPGNVKWSTSGEQAVNRSTTKWVVVDGERMPTTHACARLGFSRGRIKELAVERGITHQAACDFLVARRRIPARNEKTP